MKILLVSHNFPPVGTAGTETYTAEIARRLALRGHEVEVFTTAKDIARPHLSIERRVYAGIPVHEVFNNLYYAAFQETWLFPPIEALFRDVLEERAFDVVHFQHLLYLSAGCVQEAHARGVPVCFTLHDFWLECARFGQRVHADGGLCDTIDFARCGTCLTTFKYAQSPVERRVGEAIDRVHRHTGVNLAPLARGVAGALSGKVAAPADASARDPERADAMAQFARDRWSGLRARVLPAVDRFFAPSRFLRERFVREWEVPPERIEHLPLGVDLAVFAAATRTRSPHVRVAFIGSLIAIKGPQLLLRAWGRLAPELRERATLALYGPAHHDPAFQRELLDLSRSVGATIGGRLERGQIPGRLAEIDLLVVPSLWFENSPLVILEARAARTPLLVSDLGGMAELVERGVSGEHFRMGDVDDLARQLSLLLADPSKLAGLSARSVRPPSVDEHVDVLEARYADLLGNRDAS